MGMMLLCARTAAVCLSMTQVAGSLALSLREQLAALQKVSAVTPPVSSVLALCSAPNYQNALNQHSAMEQELSAQLLNTRKISPYARVGVRHARGENAPDQFAKV